MAYKVLDKLVLVHFFLVLSSGAPTQKEIVIKSIKSENGDIFDCINIMSQPTFQDPAFMNHTIQMIPSSYPNFINEKSQEKTTISHAEINTVPFVGKEERYSGSAAFISNGTSLDDTDFMEAGWIVSPKDFGDNKDIKTGNWWLAFGKNKKLVGYWIKSTFNHMDNGASKLSWGGDAEGPRYERSPPIGSGHFAYEGFGKAAVFMDATIVDENNNHFVPNPHDFYRQVDRTVCYGLDKLGSGPNGIGFYFGGPGGCIDN
ncbi:hypothetical protein LUZ60_016242 [Juncus effusus]|nr:hypothetical protein LUZ60_016242 [Juncus effusus]